MSKYVKNLIMKELTERFEGVDSVGAINPRGIDALKNNEMRRRLHQKGLRMTVIRNSLARKVLSDSPLKGFESLLEGPTALVYGEASISAIARALMDEKRADASLELRGIFFDGDIYPGQKGVEKISKMPTREEAIAQVVSAIVGPGRKLASAIKGPGSKIAGVLKTIEDKAKEGSAEAAPAA